MKSQQKHSYGAAIVVPERGATSARVVGHPAVAWSNEGRIAIAISRGEHLPSGERLFGRVMTGQGRNERESPWAGVAWDPAERKLVAVRDPLGEVPLSWLATEARAAAGTCSAFIAEAAGVALLPDPRRLTAYCQGLTDVSDNDFIDDVRRVRPGEVVEIAARHVNRRDHWDSPDPRDFPAASRPSRFDGSALDRLEELLADAVSRLSGPLTLALSGGVDSALIATFLAGRDDVSAMHLTSNRHPTVDEREWAKRIATATNLSLRVIDIDDTDVWGDAPASHPQAFPVSNLDVLLRREATGTLVTGIGGDQLFSGARSTTLRHLTRTGQFGALAREAGFDSTTLRSMLVGAVQSSELGAVMYDLARHLRQPGPSLIERREPWMKANAWIASDVAPTGGRLPTNGPLHRTWEWELVVRNSWATEGPSVHPFLSPPLWRWAAGLGPEDRFRNGQDKAVVRELLARRNPSLAAQVARRPKSQTFNAWAVDRLTESPPSTDVSELARLGIVLPNTFRNRLTAFQRSTRRADANWGNFHVVALWRTLAAQRWVECLSRHGSFEYRGSN